MQGDMKFPKMHIAASALNRILNFRDEIKRNTAAQPSMSTPPPSVPDPSLEGAAIDAQVATPTPAVASPDSMEQGAALDSLATGTNLIEGVQL